MGRTLRLRALVLLAALCVSCAAPQPPGDPEGWRLIERARAAHGSDVLDRATVRFTFRGDRFTVERENGRFRYVREYRDSLGLPVRDILSNNGVMRERGGRAVPLSEAERLAAETTLNSVVYFALLPYSLADPAVRPRALGRDTVRGEPYDLLEVTFAEEGGGRDWQDRFVYWIHAERAKMDYVAYWFHTGEGGSRFREAFGAREVGGVRFANYRNYTAEPEPNRLEDYPRLLEGHRLRLVSDVVLEQLTVERH